MNNLYALGTIVPLSTNGISVFFFLSSWCLTAFSSFIDTANPVGRGEARPSVGGAAAEPLELLAHACFLATVPRICPVFWLVSFP